MRFNSTISFKAPAKTNLLLKIRGRLPDSYHAIQSVITPLSLSDDMVISLGSESNASCKGSGNSVGLLTGLSPELQLHADECLRQYPEQTEAYRKLNTEGNLVYQAVKTVLDKHAELTGEQLFARIRILKRIPLGAGLGGGSADAAVALKAIYHLLGAKSALTQEYYSGVAKGLGSDVLAQWYGKPCLVMGSGDRVIPLYGENGRVIDAYNFYAVILKPCQAVNTCEAYHLLGISEEITKEKALSIPTDLVNSIDVFGVPTADSINSENKQAVKFYSNTLEGEFKNCPQNQCNVLTFGSLTGTSYRLHWKRFLKSTENDFENVVLSKWAEIAAAKRILLEAGCEKALLSGSGSTVLGFVENLGDAQEILHKVISLSPKGWFSCIVTGR